jgi:hypothetical protein
LVRFLPVLDSAGYLDKVVVGVRTIDALQVARRYPRPPRTLAFMGSQAEAPAFLAEGADIIRLWDPWVEPKAIQAIHAAGRLVWVMTGAPNDGSVGLVDPNRLAEYFRLGLDGILLNDVTLGVRVACEKGR